MKSSVFLAVVLAAGLGVVLGAAMGNVGLGIAIGGGVAVVIGLMFSSRGNAVNKAKSEPPKS